MNRRTDNNPNNDHEVHKASCYLLPLKDRIDIGVHPDCEQAMEAAKKFFDNIDGCAWCIPECHES